MTSIAYITDNKMLELNRINKQTKLNFWRLSEANNFSYFNVGDILFFLTKDKEMSRNKEKGIIGYGIAKQFISASVNTMWNKYGILNGYNTKKAFKEAIKKVSKDRHIPKIISSIYLEDVVFFQEPVYLSDAGKKISNRIESYIYLDEEGKLAFNLLEDAKKYQDIWSGVDDYVKILDRTQIRIILNAIFDKIGFKNIGNLSKTSKITRLFLKEYPEYSLIKNSPYELYKLEDNRIELIFSNLYLEDKSLKEKILIGQAHLYRNAFFDLYPYDLELKFYYLDEKAHKHIIKI